MTYLQVEISLAEGPVDVIISAMDVEGRGRTLDEAVDAGRTEANPARGARIRGREERTEQPWTWVTPLARGLCAAGKPRDSIAFPAIYAPSQKKIGRALDDI